jgi:hypothetical protein
MTGAADILASIIIVTVLAYAIVESCKWLARAVIKAVDFLTRNE